MTAHVRTLTVVLQRDTRIDDAEEIAKAIGMVRGVASVEYSVTTREEERARMTIKAALRTKIIAAVTATVTEVIERSE